MSHLAVCRLNIIIPCLQSSNVATYIAHGDVALSVLMTTASTLGAIIMTPLLTKTLAGAMIEVDAKVSQLCCIAHLSKPFFLLNVSCRVSSFCFAKACRLTTHSFAPCPQTVVLHAKLLETCFLVSVNICLSLRVEIHLQLKNSAHLLVSCESNTIQLMFVRQ